MLFIYQNPIRYGTRILDHLMVVVWRRRFLEEVTTYNATKTWASSNNFWVQLLCRRSPSGCFYGLIKGVSHKNTLRGLLLNIVTRIRETGDMKIQCDRNYVFYSLFDVFVSFPYCSYRKRQKYKCYRRCFLLQSDWSKMYRSSCMKTPELY